MGTRGGLYFPIKLRCAETSGMLRNPDLTGAIARALGRSFARARTSLPLNLSLGDGVCLHPPEVTDSFLGPDEEKQLLDFVSKAIEEAARANSLPSLPKFKPSSLAYKSPTEEASPESQIETTEEISEQFDPDRYEPATGSYEIPSYDGGKKKVPVHSKTNPFGEVLRLLHHIIKAGQDFFADQWKLSHLNSKRAEQRSSFRWQLDDFESERLGTWITSEVLAGRMSAASVTGPDRGIADRVVQLYFRENESFPVHELIARRELQLRRGLLLLNIVRTHLKDLDHEATTLTDSGDEILHDAFMDVGTHYFELLNIFQSEAFPRLAFLENFYSSWKRIGTYAMTRYAGAKLPEVWERLQLASKAVIARWGMATVPLHLSDPAFLYTSMGTKMIRSGSEHELALAYAINRAQLVYGQIEGVNYLPKVEQATGKVPHENLGALLAAEITHLQVEAAVLTLWAPIASIRDTLLAERIDTGPFDDEMNALERLFSAEVQRYPHPEGIQALLDEWLRRIRQLIDNVTSTIKTTRIKRLIIGEIPFLIMGAGVGESVNLIVRGPRWVVILAQGAALTFFNFAVHPPGPGQPISISRIFVDLGLNTALAGIGQLFRVFTAGSDVAEGLVSGRRILLRVSLGVGGAYAATTLVQTTVQSIEAHASAQGGESSFTEMLTLNLIMNGLGLLFGAALHSEPTSPGSKALADISADELVTASRARGVVIDKKAAQNWLDLAKRSQQFKVNYETLAAHAKAGKLSKEQFAKLKEEGKSLAKELEEKLPGLAKALGSAQTPDQIKSIVGKLRAHIENLQFEGPVQLLPEFTPGLTHIGDGPTWTYDPAESSKQLALLKLKKSYADRGMTINELSGGGWEVESQGRIVFQALPATKAARAVLPESLDVIAKGEKTSAGLARVRAQTAVPDLPAQLARVATESRPYEVQRILQLLARGEKPPSDTAFRGINNYLKLGGKIRTLVRAASAEGDRTGSYARSRFEQMARWDSAAVNGLEAVLEARPRTTGRQLSTLLGEFTENEVISVLQDISKIRAVTRPESLSRLVWQLMVEFKPPEKYRPGQVAISPKEKGARGVLASAVDAVKRFPGKSIEFEVPDVTPGGALRIEDIVVVEPTTGERIIVFEVKEISSAFLGEGGAKQLAANIVIDEAARRGAQRIGVQRKPYDTFRWRIRRFEIEEQAIKQLRGQGNANPTSEQVEAQMRSMLRKSLKSAFDQPEVKRLPANIRAEYRSLFDSTLGFVEFF